MKPSLDNRLQGTWKSNRRRTIATFHWSKPIDPESRAFLEKMFGKLTLTFDGRYFTSEMPRKRGEDAWIQRERYRIVASDEESLVYVFQKSRKDPKTIQRVYFDGPNRYWIYLGSSGWKEYFDRVRK